VADDLVTLAEDRSGKDVFWPFTPIGLVPVLSISADPSAHLRMPD